MHLVAFLGTTNTSPQKKAKHGVGSQTSLGDFSRSVESCPRSIYWDRQGTAKTRRMPKSIAPPATVHAPTRPQKKVRNSKKHWMYVLPKIGIWYFGMVAHPKKEGIFHQPKQMGIKKTSNHTFHVWYIYLVLCTTKNVPLSHHQDHVVILGSGIPMETLTIVRYSQCCWVGCDKVEQRIVIVMWEKIISSLRIMGSQN